VKLTRLCEHVPSIGVAWLKTSAEEIHIGLWPRATSRVRLRDARIAVLSLPHRVRELWSVDRDFSRFPALVTRNPLA